MPAQHKAFENIDHTNNIFNDWFKKYARGFIEIIPKSIFNLEFKLALGHTLFL